MVWKSKEISMPWLRENNEKTYFEYRLIFIIQCQIIYQHGRLSFDIVIWCIQHTHYLWEITKFVYFVLEKEQQQNFSGKIEKLSFTKLFLWLKLLGKHWISPRALSQKSFIIDLWPGHKYVTGCTRYNIFENGYSIMISTVKVFEWLTFSIWLKIERNTDHVDILERSSS